MKNRVTFAVGIFAILITAGLWSAAFGQTNENNLANVTAAGSTIRFEVTAQNAGLTLTITAPDGRSFTKEYKSGASPEFTFNERQELPDGNYGYELRLQPNLTPAQKEELKRARGKDDDPEAERAGRKRPVLSNMVQSGAFALMNGQVIVAGLSEDNRSAKATVQPAGTGKSLSGNTATRLRNHRISLATMFDIVQPDDVIIQGSLCVGFDCVNNESFGFDTIRLKENNTRIKFEDTSVGSFPTNDWQLTANDSASGGSSKFSIEDITGSKVPFTITAGAATNSIFVDSTGRVGLRTNTPVLDIHAKTSNTPAMRFEQSNAGGFTAQTWDIAANESNFFVRDVTGGSRLPFRIRPGAPTSSVDINDNGFVGFGITSASARITLSGSSVDDGSTGIDLINTTGNTFRVAAGIPGVSNSNFSISQSGTAYVVVMNGNGRVGIGTSAPDQQLSVNGNASKTGGGSWQTFSDARLKNLKGNFNLGLSAVMKLQPLRYEYKPDNVLGLKSEGDHVGFTAQDLQEVIPEAVTKNPNGYLMVNNDPIIWTMLNAIKEQQKEIAELKGQVRKLQAASHRRRK
jgi:endosialidase-like protein